MQIQKKKKVTIPPIWHTHVTVHPTTSDDIKCQQVTAANHDGRSGHRKRIAGGQVYRDQGSYACLAGFHSGKSASKLARFGVQAFSGGFPCGLWVWFAAESDRGELTVVMWEFYINLEMVIVNLILPFPILLKSQYRSGHWYYLNS